MSRSFYEIQYKVRNDAHLGGYQWFTACDDEGKPYRYDNITPARAALSDHGPGWRLVRVEEIRTPCI